MICIHFIVPENLPDVTMEELVYFVNNMAGKWEAIGYALGLEQQVPIVARSSAEADSRCLEMLQKWVEQGKNVSWQKLVDVLWGLGLRSAAVCVCRRLKER